jgi:hypothetical protein
MNSLSPAGSLLTQQQQLQQQQQRRKQQTNLDAFTPPLDMHGAGSSSYPYQQDFSMRSPSNYGVYGQQMSPAHNMGSAGTNMNRAQSYSSIDSASTATSGGPASGNRMRLGSSGNPTAGAGGSTAGAGSGAGSGSVRPGSGSAKGPDPRAPVFIPSGFGF